MYVVEVLVEPSVVYLANLLIDVGKKKIYNADNFSRLFLNKL